MNKDRELDKLLENLAGIGKDCKPRMFIEQVHSKIKALVIKSLGEEHTKISQIIHKVCRNTNWACDSWGEEELTVAIIAELKEKFV